MCIWLRRIFEKNRFFRVMIVMLIVPIVSPVSNMANTAIRNVTADEALSGFDRSDFDHSFLAGSAMGPLQSRSDRTGHEKMIRAFQTPDPFQALKLEQNRTANSLPDFEKIGAGGRCPVQAA